MDHLCYLCLVFVMLLRLFIAALWSPGGKGLTSWLLFVMSNVILLLSHLVSWDRWYLTVLIPDPETWLCSYRDKLQTNKSL